MRAASTHIRPKDLARELGLSPATLEKWRQKGTGPGFFRMGARVIVYPRSEVDRWLEEQHANAKHPRASTAA